MPAAASTLPSPIPNRFRQQVRAGERLIGCWCGLANPITTEMLGYAGFDWLMLDGEHSPNDITSFVHQLNALKDSASAKVVRPPTNSPVLIKQLLDIGFYNLLIPMVDSAEQAAAAVAATRYPPHGIRGVSGMQRNNRYGSVPDYFAGIDEAICVMVQIESQAGVAALDEIMAVPGVDAIFIGPADLAASCGHLGDLAHPQVQETIEDIVRRAQAVGMTVSTLAHTPDFAQRYLDLGIQVVAAGTDLGLFRQATVGLRQRFKPD